MPNPTASEPGIEQGVSQLRCIGCGAVPETASRDLRCPNCGDLLEITYPGWKSTRPKAELLKSLWRERRVAHSPAGPGIDQSGVWRFRELLPALSEDFQPITLLEGNTPVYQLPSCARIAGVERLYAKHQGMNPTGSFKDTGMTVAASFARQQGFRWVACASTGNTSASMAAYAARGGLRSLVLRS